VTRTKWIWFAALALFYAAFWLWYGGNGPPLTQAEGDKLLTRMEQMYGVKRADAPKGSILRNLADMVPKDDGREFYAVNLETRKAGAEALKAEEKYGEMVVPMLLKRGGHPVFVSERVGLMLGDYGNQIDRVGVVRYRSLRDLFDMILDPAMPEASKYKYAALDHTEVFITRPTISAVTVRLTLALLLLVIGWAGCRGMDWLAARRAG
jgi:hypothetical protein